MEEARTKYILLNDRVGENLEKNLLTLGFRTKSSPTQVLRGELLEALPEDEQPEDSRQIALVGLERNSLRLTCRKGDLTRLSDEDANLLLAISSTGGRYNTFIDRKRLEFGRKIQPGSRVYVKVIGLSKDILGVAWYKGELPFTVGTMFGVELMENRGQGTTDGTFGNKRYFTCAEDSGVFVGLDQITHLREDSTRSPRSPKKQSATSNIATRIRETVLQPFMKEKDERLTLIQGTNMVGLLDIGQRVVAYMEEKPVRGYVRYIGEEQDRRGQPFTIVGLELNSKVGYGTGVYNGKQRFVCKKDFATFLPIEAVIPEKDFDKNSGQLKNSRERRLSTAHKDNDDAVAKSMNYSVTVSASKKGHDFLKRSSSMDSAEIIKAAGEPSKTNTTEFIEKQRQILRDLSYGRLHNNEEATKSSRKIGEREDSGATEMEFDEDHYMAMSSDILNAGRGNRQEQPITNYQTEDSRGSRNNLEYNSWGGGNSERENIGATEKWFKRVRENEQQKEHLQEQPREKEECQESLQEQLRDKERQKANLEEQLRDNLVPRAFPSSFFFLGKSPWNEVELREKDQEKTNLEEKLREKEERQRSLQEQLREKEQQKESLEKQLREKDQQKTNLAEQLRGKEQQGANLEKQLREREQQKKNLEEELREREQQKANLEEQLGEKDQEKTNLEEQLREREELQGTLQEHLIEKEREKANLEEQLKEKDQEKTNLEEQLREKEERQERLQEQLREKEGHEANLQGQLRRKEAEVHELTTTLTTIRQLLNKQQQQQEARDWVINRDEIDLTDNSLGRGGWGTVVQGEFRSCKVAVKQIHQLILSPHNRRLFEREMNIASRCRHPCLLQFIGATNDDGNPLFVTELMDCSLRALLEQRTLSQTEISIISSDVAQALNYLHLNRPSPIIHRDISSANVLLWKQGDQWRGKVSDYGTANFMRHTMTVAPGAAIYSAPEAFTSAQTVKVDVYSFGVLLCEMCIRELPEPQRREEQVARVETQQLRNLVRRCIQREPAERLTMEQIIGELEAGLERILES